VRFIDYLLPEAQIAWDMVGSSWFAVPNEEDRTALTPLLGIRLGYRMVSSR
jgi:hypothetical protein